jgi:alpha-beta hydrolase superfamily lysophospholipase
LDRLGVPNQLVSIPGKGHGGFNAEERTMIYREIRAFLAKNGVTK